MVDHSICRKTFKKDFGYIVTDQMLCSSHQNGTIGPCNGDSGSPLVCKLSSGEGSKDGRWFVWGTISWGEGCARRGVYSVYANVKELLPWIKNVISPKNRLVLT